MVAALCDAFATTTSINNASDIEKRKIRSFCDPRCFPTHKFFKETRKSKNDIGCLTQKIVRSTFACAQARQPLHLFLKRASRARFCGITTIRTENILPPIFFVPNQISLDFRRIGEPMISTKRSGYKRQKYDRIQSGISLLLTYIRDTMPNIHDSNRKYRTLSPSGEICYGKEYHYWFRIYILLITCGITYNIVSNKKSPTSSTCFHSS